MYKINKDVFHRAGSLLGAMVFMAGLGTSLLPGLASADALNPLTDRSLTLSSSSPGWDYKDGSGNATYAPPNSGANGRQTGNTFDFKVSTDTTSSGTNEPIKTMSFQYCTKSAGDCMSPGDNAHGTGTGTITTTASSTAVTGTGTAFDTQLAPGARITTAGGNTYTVASVTDATNLVLTANVTAAEAGVSFDYRGADTSTTSDLNVASSSPTEVSSSDFSSIIATSSTNGDVSAIPNRDDSQGNFVVYYYDTGTSTWVQSSGWAMSVANVETGTIGANTATGADNYIVLANNTGLGIPADTRVKVSFFGTDSNYITNPGSGAFFVKINTYKAYYDGSTVTLADLQPTSSTNVIDGGVTVANVMNHSIAIQTKVLETMQFSVGTVDPNTLSSTDTDANSGNGIQSPLKDANGNDVHGTCDPVLGGLTPSAPQNVLKLGDQSAESSLAVEHTYSTHSYWRLSSNSSAGATVYYSGVSLSNTVGDVIDPIGPTAAAPLKGKEQFGLALATQGATDFLTSYANEDNSSTGVFEHGADNGLGFDATTTTDNTGNAAYHPPKLAPLAPTANYGDGAGAVNIEYGSIDTSFAFDADSNTVPVAMAEENADVVDCVTGRVRYIANIAATTPAGIYTTKINYIAAPQY